MPIKNIKLEEILQKGVAEINVLKDLTEQLNSSKKLRIKFGIDPTGTDLTLGHAVALRKLKQFQDLGHHIILLFGNFTAQIGDPTGKTQTRKVLTKAEVEKNATGYLEQASKVIDINKVEVVYNYDWLSKMNFADVLHISKNFTVSQMLERDMFQQRIQKNQHINLVEFMYPLMQGYDSVVLKADLEIGGTDQLFNMMCARPLQKAAGQKPQNVLTVPILTGTDGQEKMSKSLGNYIALNDSAQDMFGKIMSIPDSKILEYFELTTTVSLSEIETIKKDLASGTNPRDIKMSLAKQVVTLYFSSQTATQANQEFLNIFQKNKIPEKIPKVSYPEKELQLWALVNKSGLCQNSSDSKRMIEQGSVKINGEKKDNKNEVIPLTKEIILQIGKRKWLKIKGN